MVDGQPVCDDGFTLVNADVACKECGPLSLVERIIVFLSQLSYAIKNQLGHPKPPRGHGRGHGSQHKEPVKGTKCMP